VVRIGIFLIVAALIAGMSGCYDEYPLPPCGSQDLEIRTWYDLDVVKDNLCGNHLLMNDLDSTTPGYEELAGPTANGGQGWEPIGSSDVELLSPFKGTFDGQGYEIHDLFIHGGYWGELGLFGLSTGVIKNIGVVNATVIGVGTRWDGRYYAASHVGGLVGKNSGTVSNSYSTGNVTGGHHVGGLVGGNSKGTVSHCHFTGSVTGDERVGGLVGGNWASSVTNSYCTGNVTGSNYVGGLVGKHDGTVSGSHSTGTVTGNSSVGGLVGWNSATVSGSYSTGNTTGRSSVGGLVGVNWDKVTDSHSTGDVAGDSNVGGLVGKNENSGTVSDAYCTASAAGDKNVGGLVGYNYYGTVNNCYSAGTVTGNSSVGGLLGANTGDAGNSFWDTETSGQATSDGGMGKTTAAMQAIATFSGAGWDITAVDNPGTRDPSYIWNIVGAVTYPFLSWQP
jgi:hypothetical protein